MTTETFERLNTWLAFQSFNRKRFGWIRPQPSPNQRPMEPGPGGECALLAFRREKGPAELSAYEVNQLSESNDRSKGDPMAVGFMLAKLWSRQTDKAFYRPQRAIAVRV